MGEQRGEECEAMGEEEDGPLVLAVSSSLDLCQPAASNVMDSLCDVSVPCSCRRCARSDGAFINLWVGIYFAPFLVIPCSLTVILSLILLRLIHRLQVLVLLFSSSLDLCQPAASSSRDVQVDCFSSPSLCFSSFQT